MKNVLMILTLAAGTAVAAPSVTVTSVSQAADRTVAVAYNLSGGPAIVTFGLTVGGEAVGGDLLTGGLDCKPQPTGDVMKRVATGDHSFTWLPSPALNAQLRSGQARLAVRAWPLDNGPDYMVVNVQPGATDRVRFYPDLASLPGGLLSNRLYRTGAIVLRKMPAKGVKWKYQNFSTATYHVTMPCNYYIGVFEITQGQWFNVYGETLRPNYDTLGYEGLPMEKVSYRDIRESTDNNPNETYMFPNPPNPDSFLGKLRTLSGTGFAFDLPSEIEWEYAARAGYSGNASSGYWNNGVAYSGSTWGTDMPGRHKSNQATTGWPTGDYAAEVGRYAPSDWGVYDMHGNVWEWCLDWYMSAGQDATTAPNLVNAAGKYAYSGTAATVEGQYRSVRGGCFSATDGTWFLAGKRNAKESIAPSVRDRTFGFRIVCKLGE